MCVILSRLRESVRNTKSPPDPVYLDIDPSLVNRKQSTQWSKDAVFSWRSPRGRAPGWSGWAINTGHHSKHVPGYDTPSTSPSQYISSFQWWFTDISTLGVKYTRGKEIKSWLGFMHYDPRLRRIWTGSTNDFGAFLFNTS